MTKRYQRILATMKDILVIDSSLLVNFQAETIDISNYLPNRLFTKYSKHTIILEVVWIGNRQKVQHFQICDCKAYTFIPDKKCIKSDIHKTWRGIYISYRNTNKYVQVQALWMHQILIASKFIFNKRQLKVQFLIEYPMPLLKKPLGMSSGKPRLWNQPYKDVLGKQT